MYGKNRMMNILIVTQYFWPENFKINDLATDLVHRGNQVTVLTGLPNYPEGKLYRGYKYFRHLKESYQGIDIIRVPMIPRFKGRGWQLFLNYLSYALMASLYGRFSLRGDFDKIFVFEISPVTVGIPAIIIRKKFKIPHLFWVLDLWPESVFAASGLKTGWLNRLLTKLVKYIYNRCDAILISSKGFQKSIEEKGIQPDKIYYFPNWAENLFVDYSLDTNYNLPELPEGFRVMFAGNIGEAQDFEAILSAAEKLREFPEIKWIIVGEGRKREWLVDQIKHLELGDNFFWMGKFPVTTMPWFFSQADVLLISLKKDPIFSLTVPGKLQSYFASKKPVVGMISGEGGKIISEAKAGFSGKSSDAKALAENILRIFNMNSETRVKLSENGYAYYLENFEKSKLIDSLTAIFKEVNYSKMID